MCDRSNDVWKQGLQDDKIFLSIKVETRLSRQDINPKVEE